MQWAIRAVGERTGLGGTLTKVSPLMGARIAKSVRHGTVGAIDDTGAAGMNDTRDSLFLGIHGLGQERFRLMARRFT